MRIWGSTCSVGVAAAMEELAKAFVHPNIVILPDLGPSRIRSHKNHIFSSRCLHDRSSHSSSLSSSSSLTLPPPPRPSSTAVYGVQISPYPVKGIKTTKFTISTSTSNRNVSNLSFLTFGSADAFLRVRKWVWFGHLIPHSYFVCV